MEVMSIPYVNTKSRPGEEIELPDTLAYLFNYDDDNGFAIISADQRIGEPVLAYALSGNMNDEQIDNPGMAVFLDNVAEYIIGQIRQADHARDSLMQVLSERYKDTYSGMMTKNLIDDPSFPRITTHEIPVEPWKVESKVGPLLPVEWGQNGFFNNDTPSLYRPRPLSSNSLKTGCVATAAAQIMAYWKYPQKIETVTFNWNEINAYTGLHSYHYRNNLYKNWTNYIGVGQGDKNIRDQASFLMYAIGKNSDMEWGETSSGTKTYKARDYLRRLGYKGGEESKWSFNAVLSSLDAGCPVLVRGDRTFKYTEILGQKIGWTEDGHAWVVDGYLKRSQLTQFVVVYHPPVQEPRPGELPSKELPIQEVSYFYKYSRLAHMNWGWDGRNNGYFAEGCFDANSTSSKLLSNTKSTESDSHDDSGDVGSEGNYKYNNKIYTNIRK